ncbi:hypothetical protein CCACVL1_30529, partial [Corchorus capsularis]
LLKPLRVGRITEISPSYRPLHIRRGRYRCDCRIPVTMREKSYRFELGVTSRARVPKTKLD